MLRRFLPAFAVLALLGLASPVGAVPPVSAPDGVALQGYDTVAYFKHGEARKGKLDFAYQWKGAIWLFSTAENRAAFVADPEKFAPQYGGYCSLSVANGKTARGSGEAWRVENGKLYLNYDMNVRDRWLRDVSDNIRKADEWWPKLVDKN